MRKNPLFLALLAATILSPVSLAAQREIGVLVFAEGYRYGKAAFELAQMLDEQKEAGLHADFANTENILNPESLAGYDVLVLFNHNDITATHEKNVADFVSGGKGLVALHHVINKANDNPELTRLIGGYYQAEDGMVQHRDFHIMRIPGKQHPILEEVPENFLIKNDQDFVMKFYPGQQVERLLTCDVTDNGDQEDCGWTRTEGAGRVVFLSPGDPVEERPFIVNQPLSRLIVNAVRWSAGTR
ncbi:MAG: ThuA domain-containing protein [Candidatus Glassbacteria bacterium]|nr:ThuA domain-containing protein [Candidatus Glassbacteria bacterium]